MLVDVNPLSEELLAVIEQILLLEKKEVYEFEGVTLYPSEIHLFLYIKRERNTNATRMAESLGVTKGAISQTLSKLERKGIIKKEKDANNKNELQIYFTSYGNRAVDFFLKKRMETAKEFNYLFADLNMSDSALLDGFLKKLKHHIKS